MASDEMFGFGVIFAIVMAMSLGLVLRIQGPRKLYARARNDPETFFIQAIFMTCVLGMASITIYVRFWLEIVPKLLAALTKLWLTICDDYLDPVENFFNIIDAIYDFCAPIWVFYSMLFHRLGHPSECSEADFDELAYCLVLPALGGFIFAISFDYIYEWPALKMMLSFAQWLLACAKFLALAMFWSSVAAGKVAWKYARDMYTAVNLSAENTNLKAKLERSEAALAEVLVREANAIITLALFGKKLKVRGDKILSLEATTHILRGACDIWFQESESLKQGMKPDPQPAHEHQMNLMQQTIDQLTRRLGLLGHNLTGEEKLTQDLRAVNDRAIKASAKSELEKNELRARHEAQLKKKTAEIECLHEQILRRNDYEVKLEDELEEQKQATLHERATRRRYQDEVRSVTSENYERSNAVKQLQRQLHWYKTTSIHSPVKVVEVPASPSPPTSAREARLEYEIDKLEARIHHYRRQERLALEIQADAPQAGIDYETLQEIKNLKHEKKLLQDKANMLEKERTEAARKSQELQTKLDEQTRAYADLAASQGKSVAESSKRADALQTDLETRSAALEEKTQAHSELAHMHSQCPSQKEYQDLVAQNNASKNLEGVLHAELERLSNIEKEKALAESKEIETAGRLQQAEATIATQQTLLQRRNSTQHEQAGTTEALQKLDAANNQVALLQKEIERLSNVEQEKIAADNRAAQAMQQLQDASAETSQQMQQAQTKFDEQQGSLNQAVQRIQELESQAQGGDQRVGALHAQIKAAKEAHKQDLVRWTQLKNTLDKGKTDDKASIQRLNDEVARTRTEAQQEIQKRDSQIERLQINSTMTTSHEQDREELRRTNVKYAKCLQQKQKLEAELSEPCASCGQLEQEYQELRIEKERLEEENEEMVAELNVADEEFEVDDEVGALNFSQLREECMNLKVEVKALKHETGKWKEQYKRQEAAFQREQGSHRAAVRALENQLTSSENALDDQLRENTALQRRLDAWAVDPDRPPIETDSEEDEDEEDEGDSSDDDDDEMGDEIVE